MDSTRCSIPGGETDRLRKRAATLLEVLSAIALGAVLLRAEVGPLHFEALGASLSVRSLSRPLVLAGLALAARVWLAPPSQRLAAGTIAASRSILGAVLCAGVLGWISFLSTTCGGADSYGYVSAAERLRSGDLVHVEPLARVLPFADGISAATPLGYTPSSRVADASVPVYPLGLPALMAFAMTVAGKGGPFIVAPLMGLLLLGAVYLTMLYATRDRLLALAAAALTAVQPLVFTYSIQPMSDVPAAAFFVAAVGALFRQPNRPLLAGCAGIACLLIRPALTPALAALCAIPMIVQGRLDVRTAVRYAATLACGVAVLFAVQWYLYGHPLANGYADMGSLFSLERIGVNARSHGYWAWRSLGPLFLGAAAIGVILVPRPLGAAVVLVMATVTAPYLAYRTFDHWETLRFLLPAVALLSLPAAAGLIALARSVAGAAGGALAASLLVLVIAHTWTTWLRVNTVFTMPDQESRYRLAGELVSQTAPANAVILAQLHSGSIRYYAHRESVNWERIPSGALPATLAALEQAGHPAYLLIDSDEERSAFERRHGPTAAWLPAGQRRNVQLFEASRTQSRDGR
jgi:hypothetical protein